MPLQTSRHSLTRRRDGRGRGGRSVRFRRVFRRYGSIDQRREQGHESAASSSRGGARFGVILLRFFGFTFRRRCCCCSSSVMMSLMTARCRAASHHHFGRAFLANAANAASGVPASASAFLAARTVAAPVIDAHGTVTRAFVARRANHAVILAPLVALCWAKLLGETRLSSR